MYEAPSKEFFQISLQLMKNGLFSVLMVKPRCVPRKVIFENCQDGRIDHWSLDSLFSNLRTPIVMGPSLGPAREVKVPRSCERWAG